MIANFAKLMQVILASGAHQWAAEPKLSLAKAYQTACVIVVVPQVVHLAQPTHNAVGVFLNKSVLTPWILIKQLLVLAVQFIITLTLALVRQPVIVLLVNKLIQIVCGVTMDHATPINVPMAPQQRIAQLTATQESIARRAQLISKVADGAQKPINA